MTKLKIMEEDPSRYAVNSCNGGYMGVWIRKQQKSNCFVTVPILSGKRIEKRRKRYRDTKTLNIVGSIGRYFLLRHCTCLCVCVGPCLLACNISHAYLYVYVCFM